MGRPEDEAEYEEKPTGSLVPVDNIAAQKAFAELESGVKLRLHPTIMYHVPDRDAQEKGEAFDPYDQISWYQLIVLGYPNDLKYFQVTQQGQFAYLRSVELRAQAMGIEVPVIDTPTILAYDNDLVGLDRNAKEVERERRVNAEMFAALNDTAVSDKTRLVYSSLFYKDANAGRLRHAPLTRILEEVGDREKAYVETFRRSPLYVDEAHERAFLLPASILHGMFRVKEDLANLKRAFGE